MTERLPFRDITNCVAPNKVICTQEQKEKYAATRREKNRRKKEERDQNPEYVEAKRQVFLQFAVL